MSRFRFETRLANVILYGSVISVLVFFYIPIVTLVAFSFTESRFLTFPIEGFSLKWYSALFAEKNFLPALWGSLKLSLIVTLLATTLGTVAAMAFMRFKFRFQRSLQVLTFAPLLFPQLMLGVVMLLWFSILGNFFDFSMALWSAVLGHVVYITPFALIIIAVQIHGFDDTLEDAARDSGCSNWEVLREITIPILWPGIFSAAIFAFLLSWGNFYPVSYTHLTLPTN